jgi:hypothetical protein
MTFEHQLDTTIYEQLHLELARYIAVLQRFWHKLNYFSFCQSFEKLFVTCAEIFIKLKKFTRF